MAKEKGLKALKSVKAVAVVNCDVCGKMHLADGFDFVVIYGNVGVGANERNAFNVKSGNLDERGKLIGSSIFCRGSCFLDFAAKICEKNSGVVKMSEGTEPHPDQTIGTGKKEKNR